mmetsp:Transcript_35854/g.78553  ORF Transcript_35854/g.78553 Transcript_35854/m.78553 type:complete len:111 (-) Transcript_35854:448-780(-)
MELVTKQLSRTSSQAPSSVVLILVAIGILAGPVVSVILTLFADLNVKECTEQERQDICPQWQTYYDAVLGAGTFWFLDLMPRLAASALTLHLSICAGYIGLIHLGVIDPK